MTILIPVKAASKRCPGKNEKLLRHTLEWLKSNGVTDEDNVVVLTDENGDELYGYAYKYSFVKEVWVEKDRNPHQSELESIYNYIKDKDIDKYFQFNVTQPCRDKALIDRNLLSYLDEYDLVTSVTLQQDRKIFEVDSELKEFIIKDIPRTGSATTEKYYADGAMYLTTKAFTKQCVESLSSNKTFWNSKVKFIFNKAPFVDIDTNIDIERFLQYYKNDCKTD